MIKIGILGSLELAQCGGFAVHGALKHHHLCETRQEAFGVTHTIHHAIPVIVDVLDPWCRSSRYLWRAESWIVTEGDGHKTSVRLQLTRYPKYFAQMRSSQKRVCKWTQKPTFLYQQNWEDMRTNCLDKLTLRMCLRCVMHVLPTRNPDRVG
jgi:hypothetical protein